MKPNYLIPWRFFPHEEDATKDFTVMREQDYSPKGLERTLGKIVNTLTQLEHYDLSGVDHGWYEGDLHVWKGYLNFEAAETLISLVKKKNKGNVPYHEKSAASDYYKESFVQMRKSFNNSRFKDKTDYLLDIVEAGQKTMWTLNDYQKQKLLSPKVIWNNWQVYQRLKKQDDTVGIQRLGSIIHDHHIHPPSFHQNRQYHLFTEKMMETYGR